MNITFGQAASWVSILQASLTALAILVSAATAIAVQQLNRHGARRDARLVAKHFAEELLATLEVCIYLHGTDPPRSLPGYPKNQLKVAAEDIARAATPAVGSAEGLNQIMTLRNIPAFICEAWETEPRKLELLLSAQQSAWSCYSKMCVAFRLPPRGHNDLRQELRKANPESDMSRTLEELCAAGKIVSIT